MNRRLFSLCAVTLMTALLVTLSVEAAQPSPLDVSRLVPSYLVKVTRLTGLGPDGIRQQLMAAPEGVTVPVDDFSSLAVHLTVDKRATPVAYHTLQAELAPGVFVFDEAGNVVRVAQSGSAPRLIPLVGAVLSQNGEVKALGLKPELLQPERHYWEESRRHDDD
jgi:hypothetical protein